METSLWAGILVVLVCIGLSAFFSMTETAVTSISNLKAKHMQETHGRSARILSLWLQHPHRVLTSLLIGNNLVNIFSSIFADSTICRHFGETSVILVAGIMTFVIVLFAEVIPKTFAKTHAYRIVVPILTLYKVFYFLLLPFSFLLSSISNFFHGFFIRKKTQDPQITEEELEFLIDVGEQEGVIPEQKHEMLSGIFELGDTIVREIMVHRIDVTALSQSTKIWDAVEKFRDSGVSRIPIYEEKIDNIIGIIHSKDALFFFKKHQKENPEVLENATVLDIKRDVMFVPESKPIDLLFQDMRRHRQQMAIVLDEYGGTSGLVTMEDIFEEIVGEVRDEFDREEDAIKPTQVMNQFLVECKIHIDDFCDFFDIEIKDLCKDVPLHEFDTLAGYILYEVGRIPKTGEVILLKDNISVEVVEVSKRRVRRVVVKITDAAETKT